MSGTNYQRKSRVEFIKNFMLNDGRDFSHWFRFLSSRSSGPGGQNVNKVNSKIELHFNINKCTLLSDDEKNIILEKLANKINNDNELIIIRQTERSQLKNKEKTIESLYSLIEKALKPVKPRSKTKPSKASINKRLDEKRKNAEKKILRKKEL